MPYIIQARTTLFSNSLTAFYSAPPLSNTPQPPDTIPPLPSHLLLAHSDLPSQLLFRPLFPSVGVVEMLAPTNGAPKAPLTYPVRPPTPLVLAKSLTPSSLFIC